MPYYVCQTKVNSELLAKVHLERQEYEVYLPTIKNKPYLPGYLFVLVKEDQMVSPCANTKGVQRLISFGNGITPCPNRDIEILKSISFDEIEDDVFPIGSMADIKKGPFKYFKALIKAKRADRIFVLIKMFGRDVETEIDAKLLQAA